MATTYQNPELQAMLADLGIALDAADKKRGGEMMGNAFRQGMMAEQVKQKDQGMAAGAAAYRESQMAGGRPVGAEPSAAPSQPGGVPSQGAYDGVIAREQAAREQMRQAPAMQVGAMRGGVNEASGRASMGAPPVPSAPAALGAPTPMSPADAATMGELQRMQSQIGGQLRPGAQSTAQAVAGTPTPEQLNALALIMERRRQLQMAGMGPPPAIGAPVGAAQPIPVMQQVPPGYEAFVARQGMR